MSNYADYFGDLVDKARKREDIDFGDKYDKKFSKADRNYRYTHPNQLRHMTTHSNNKVQHNKTSDLLGAIEMLNYKPPPILPISEYLKQVKGQEIPKKKPFNISETEHLTNKARNPMKKPDMKKPIGFPNPNTFKGKVEGQVPPNVYFKMNEMDRMNYDKKIATEFRDKGLGAYRPPRPPKPEPKLAPPPEGGYKVDFLPY